MMTITELMGIGTRENLNRGMLLLQGMFVFALAIIPFCMGEITHRKKYYLLAVFSVPAYMVVLAILAKLICHNPAQSIFLIVYAIMDFWGYAVFITVRLWQKKKQGHRLL